ncbi:MAG: hypothetical protein PHR94_05050 [Methylomonas lenta]|nr:hypothetical protein [Methylomonas lenta]
MKNLKLVLAAAGFALASSGVNAAIMSVTVSGQTVDFSYQYDSSLPNLFNLGIYSVSGDSLSFSPTNFIAHQNGLTGWSTSTATTPLVTVTAKAGYALTNLSLFEQGDYYRSQSGTNMTMVSVGGQFIVDNNPSSIISSQPLTTAMSAAGLFDQSETFQTSAWSVSSNVALNNALSATAKVENILRAGVNLNATALDEAFIEKKLMKFTAATTTVVPVPGAFWLFGSALTGVLVSRRRNTTA